VKVNTLAHCESTASAAVVHQKFANLPRARTSDRRREFDDLIDEIFAGCCPFVAPFTGPTRYSPPPLLGQGKKQQTKKQTPLNVAFEGRQLSVAPIKGEAAR
jgi:hypothetical protein